MKNYIKYFLLIAICSLSACANTRAVEYYEAPIAVPVDPSQQR